MKYFGCFFLVGSVQTLTELICWDLSDLKKFRRNNAVPFPFSRSWFPETMDRPQAAQYQTISFRFRFVFPYTGHNGSDGPGHFYRMETGRTQLPVIYPKRKNRERLTNLGCFKKRSVIIVLAGVQLIRNRALQSAVFNSGQKMALRAFYFIRALTKALTYYYINRSQRHLLATIENN